MKNIPFRYICAKKKKKKLRRKYSKFSGICALSEETKQEKKMKDTTVKMASFLTLSYPDFLSYNKVCTRRAQQIRIQHTCRSAESCPASPHHEQRCVVKVFFFFFGGNSTIKDTRSKGKDIRGAGGVKKRRSCELRR